MKLTSNSIVHNLLLFAASFITLLLEGRTASAADYPATILADNPIAYYRFEETSGTVAADSSASGAFPATYFYSTDNLYPELGQPGIDTNSIVLSAADPAFVYAGYYDQFNEQAPFSFEIWAKPASVDPVNYRCPVGNFSGWAVAKTSGWYVYQTPGTPSTSSFEFVSGDQNVYINAQGVTPGNWYYLAGTFDGTNFSFYVNGVLIGTQNDANYLANSTAGSYNSLGIGERGDDSQFFDGGLDEFAYYTNALTAAQILNHYEVGTNSFRAGNLPPSILEDVASTTVYAGDAAQFSVLVSGTPPFTYQWYKGDAPLMDETNDSLSFTCDPTDDGTTYYVAISNAFGSVNSSVATLTVLTNVLIDAPLTSITRNAGSAAAFEIVAEGAGPITYQWHNGDGSLIPGATNSVLWLSNVQMTNNGATYYVSVINPYMSTNSEPATLNVQARPVTVPVNGYAKMVAADGAVALWQLNETNGSSTAVDSLGSFDGAYLTNLAGIFTFGEPTGIPNDTNTALGLASGSYTGTIPQGETVGATVDIPYALEINPVGAFTVDGWFKASSVTTGGNDYRTVISSISNPYGEGPTGWLVYQTAGNNWAWWPYSGYYGGGQLTDNDQVVANQWYYLALVYDGTTFTFYVNGVAKASGTVPGFTQNGNVPATAGSSAFYNYNYNVTPGLPSYGVNGYGSASLVIGQRSDNDFNPFSGSVADVAVYNRALTPAQIRNHFLNTTSIAISSSGNSIVISWPVGTLQSSTNVSGPYNNVIGATSPYTNTVSGTKMFFRTQLQ
jgi:Concanavalin A-like lectin/glucanases superfamily/Immunoglobulin I-set domain